jgi:hypothetical protein
MRTNLIMIICCIMILSGCNSEKQKYSLPSKNAMLTKEVQAEYSDIDYVQKSVMADTIRKFTKNSYIKFKKQNPSEYKLLLDSLIKMSKGFTQSENYEKTYFESYKLGIKIPSAGNDYFINNLIKTLGKPLTISVDLMDFTDNYYDSETRLKSRKIYLDKCLDLLKRTNKIEDLITIEEKVADIQEEIDQLSGTIQKYDNQIKYYSITLELISDEFIKQVDNDYGFFVRMWSSIKYGWTGLFEFILLLVSIWPFIVILGIGGFYIFRFIKKSSNKKLANKEK